MHEDAAFRRGRCVGRGQHGEQPVTFAAVLPPHFSLALLPAVCGEAVGAGREGVEHPLRKRGFVLVVVPLLDVPGHGEVVPGCAVQAPVKRARNGRSSCGRGLGHPGLVHLDVHVEAVVRRALGDLVGGAAGREHVTHPVQRAGREGLRQRPGRNEDGGRARGDGERTCLSVEAGGPDHRIGVERVRLQRVQGEAARAGDGDRLLDLIRVEEDQDRLHPRVQIGLRRIRQRHHDEPVLAGVVEPGACVDAGLAAQPEERRALTDAQDLAQVCGCRVHVCRRGVEVRIGQQRRHDLPAALVVPGRRQAHAEVVAAFVPVNPVEPVARVVAVAVERLGAQEVAAHLEERDALGQADQADPHVLAAHPISHRRGRDAAIQGSPDPAGVAAPVAVGQLEDILVEQRFVVVLLDVVDRFLRIVGEGRALAVPVRTAAAQRGAQLIGGGPQVGLAALVVRVAVPVVRQPVDEALAADARRVLAVAAVAGVADDIVERADAGAGHVPLARVAPAAGAIREALGQRGTEVPPLAVEVDLASINTVRGHGQSLQRSLDVLHVPAACGSSSGRSGSHPPYIRPPTG